MQPYLEKFLLAFIPLFVAIDPIGLVAIFLGLGGHIDPKRRQIEGTLGLVTSLAVSIGFIFLGKIIFRALGITVSDFQIAGGLLLLVDTVGILFTVVALLVNLLLVGLGFRYASHFTRWMGKQGMKGISKLISLLLAAIAVSLIRRGWQTT